MNYLAAILFLSGVICHSHSSSYSSHTSSLSSTAGGQWWKEFNRGDTSTCAIPGFFVNPLDCTKFFRCVDQSTEWQPQLTRFDFDCAPGTVFDEEISVCNFPSPRLCGGRGGSGSASFTIDESYAGSHQGGGDGWSAPPPPPPKNHGWSAPPPPPPKKHGWSAPPPPPKGNNLGWSSPSKGPRPANPSYEPSFHHYQSYSKFEPHGKYTIVYSNSKK